MNYTLMQACVPSAVVQSVYLKGGKEEEAAATERWRCLKAEVGRL